MSQLDIDSLLATIGAFEETFAETPRESIRRTRPRGERSGAMSALKRGDATDSLLFDKVLGKGGMGTVHLAEQRSLGRHVAVKRLNKDNQEALHKDALLSEGWILGALEHPNIPPVHDAILDANGDPLLLLKRIEGVEWSELLGDEETVRERFGESLLDWNLGVLDAVCNALGYAHSKDIVHRDLKPENIMIGAFGEVYVLDWGIAATLHKDPDGRLPFIGDRSQPAGTPCFMAPELLDADPGRVDKRTDVYLVGGVLYEVLTGTPPHTGETMRAVTESILRSEPKFPEHIPTPLDLICAKAMKANPDERYASIEELQLDLRSYQQRRASVQLIQEANERLRNLQIMAKEAATEEHSSQMFSIFSECRFAFRQALSAFPDDREALEGLRQVTELMARKALQNGELHTAKSFIRELRGPPQDILDALAALSSRAEQKRRWYEKLERHRDAEVGKAARVALVALFALIMGGGALFGEVAMRFFPEYVEALTVVWQVWLLLAFVAGFSKVSLEETESNKLTFVVIFTALVGQLLATIISVAARNPLEITMLVDSAVWVSAAIPIFLALGRIYIITVLGYLVCMLIIAFSPQHMYYGIALGNFVMTINAGIVYVRKASSPSPEPVNP